MQKTTAPGSVGGQYVDDNPALGVVGTLNVAADRNATQDELVNAIEGSGITASGADTAQLLKAMKRLAIERGMPVGAIYALPDRKVPVAWADPDTYFPAFCLSDIDGYADITAAALPDLAPYLRAIKSGYKLGMTGAKTAFDVTNWAIAANVATLTFANAAAEIAFITALGEDQSVHGSFTGWRTITLASNIGNIPAGTYAITAITPASRTLTFACVATTGSGAVTATAEFYAHRIAGDATGARLFGVQGMALHAANDANNYFIGTLRRRSYLMGHEHTIITGTSGGTSNVNVSRTGGDGNLSPTDKTDGVTSDGTNGTPRWAKETHGPALAMHFYMHAGRKAS